MTDTQLDRIVVHEVMNRCVNFNQMIDNGGISSPHDWVIEVTKLEAQEALLVPMGYHLLWDYEEHDPGEQPRIRDLEIRRELPSGHTKLLYPPKNSYKA